MRNVRILAATLLLTASSLLSAQVRESVVLVRPNPGEDRTASFRNIADFFRKRNLGDLADYFDAMSKNTGFGSGFLTRDPYGRLIAVTNRHVTAFSTAAKVAVTREDGTERAFPDCPVIYEDPDLDIAVLLLPKDAEAGARVLRLADSVPTDGEEVWTAGYPGLFGNPSWQLAKGVVSNRRLSVEALGPPEYAVFTQHSAPIDPGNSGGPLLTGDPRNPESLRVVGVNTWMIQGRQNANFAVHLDKLRESLGRIPDPVNSIDPLPVVRAKTERIVEGINSNAWNRSDSGRYISTRLAMRQGWGSFLAHSASGAEAEAWVLRFLTSPEDTMREAVYHKIFQTIRGKGQTVSLVSIEERTDAEGQRFVRAALSAGSTTYYLDWYEEAGNSRIASAEILGKESSEKQAQYPENNEDSLLTYKEPDYSFPSGWMFSFSLGLQNVESWKYDEDIMDYVSETSRATEIKFGYDLGLGKMVSIGAFASYKTSFINTGFPSAPIEKANFTTFGASIKGGYPIRITSMLLFPYMEAGFGLGWMSRFDDEYAYDGSSTFFGLGAIVKKDNFAIGISFMKDNSSIWEPSWGSGFENISGWSLSVFCLLDIYGL